MKTLEYNLKLTKSKEMLSLFKKKKLRRNLCNHKQIQNTKNILLTLKEDIKRANYEENII